MEAVSATFSQQFIQIMDDLGKRMGVAIDWGSTNIVPYLQDFLLRLNKYFLIERIFFVIISIFCFSLGIFLFFKCGKTAIKFVSDCADNSISTILWFFSFFLTFLEFIGCTTNIPVLIKIMFAPELYIIQIIQTLI